MSKYDDKIKLLLEKIDTQKKSLGTKPSVSWKTNCLFRFDDKRSFNLNTVKDTSLLVEALAHLLDKMAMRDLAAQELDVDVPRFEWTGFQYKEWEADFKLKVKLLKWNNQQKKLEDLQSKLKSLVSKDTKTQMALDEIEALLK